MASDRPIRTWFGIGGVAAAVGIALTSLNLRPAVTSISPLFTRIDAEVPLGAAGMSLLGMLPTLMFGLAGFFTLRLVHRFGLERVAVAALAAIAVGSLARGFAPTATLLAAASVLALGGAGVGNIVCPPLIKKYFPHRLSGMGVLYTVGLQVGTVIPALVTVSLADALGWRMSLASWALLAAVAIVPWALELRASGNLWRRPSSSGKPQPATRSLPAWRTPLGVSMAVFFGTNSLLTYAFFTWLPRIIEEVLGMGQVAGGIALALFSAVGLLTAIAVPMLAARMSNPYPLVVAAVVVYAVCFAGLWFAPRTMPWALVVLLGFGPATFPLLLTLINLRTRTHQGSAALSGLSQGVGYILASLGPALFGGLWSWGGSLGWPLVFLSVVLVVMLLAAAVACRPRMLEDELAQRNVRGLN